MASFVPVDHDPFAQQAAPARAQEGPQLIPVDHDPFAASGGPGAFLTGVRQGLTAEFGDEALAGLQMQRARRERGGIPAGRSGVAIEERDRQRALETERARMAQLEKESPFLYGLGNVVGGVATPGFGVARAATLPGRTAAGAGLGGVYGGLSGAGSGTTPEDRLTKAATGTIIGTGVGAAAAPVVEGLVRGGQALARPVANLLRGAVDPEAEAARRVVSTLQRDTLADPNATARLTPQEFHAARAEGQPVSVMDLGGEATRGLARSATNTSPEGRHALGDVVNDRFAGQSQRVSDWFRGAFNFPNARATEEALEATKRATNNAAYARARHEGAGGIWTPELERLAGSDAVSAAMQKAAKTYRDESIISGHGAMNPRITFTEDGRIQFNKGPNGVPTYPDLQYWDLVRRELSDAAIKAGRGTSEARRFEQFAKAMNAELDIAVSSYKAAREGAAGFFKAENALEAGEKFVLEKFNNEGTRRALANMSPTERQLFQDGFVSKFIDVINRTGDRRNLVNQIYNTPEAKEKIAMVLGPQRAKEFEARLRLENIMDRARTAQGNSTTARQQFELAAAGGLGGYGVIETDPHALAASAFLAGRRGIDQRVSRRVAEMLASKDPKVLQRGLQVVARSPRMMDALRAFDRRLARTGGQQSGTLAPALGQGPMRAAAEDEQR